GKRNDGRRALRLRLGLVLAEALLGFLLGPFLGLFVVLAAALFVALARLGSIALGALARVAFEAPARLFLGDLALFGLSYTGVGERMGAGAALFLGQCAQHDAGRLRRRGSRLCRRGYGRSRLAGGA